MIRCQLCRQTKKIVPFVKINIYAYFLCKNCNTLFLYPLPAKRKIVAYYRYNFDYTNAYLQEKRIRKQANKVLKHLIRLNPQGKTLLDIGSGMSFFLNEAKKYNLKLVGIEPSRYLYKLSIKQFVDLNLINTTFDQYIKQNRTRKFDFITLIHVVEHLNNPIKTIKQIINLLNKNGILYIETPNLDSHLFYAEKTNYTFLTPPDHIWIFSKKSVQRIIKDIKNVQIEKISTYSYPEHFMGIIKALFKKNKHYNAFIDKNGKKKRSIYHFDIKSLILDKFLAKLLTPLLNMGIYGSILELYIKKY